VSNYYFTSARILDSTTAQLAKVEAIPEFPWRTAIQVAVATAFLNRSNDGLVEMDALELA